MKYFLFILGLCFQQALSAQAGNYEHRSEYPSDTIIHRMELREDGSYGFTAYYNRQRASGDPTRYSSEGHWSLKDGIVTFSQDSLIRGTGIPLDLRGTRARLMRPAARRLPDRPMEISLILFESPVFWLSNAKLVKVEGG